MSEEFHIEQFKAPDDFESWEQVTVLADRIIDAAGMTLGKGSVASAWRSSFFDKTFVLTRQIREEGYDYRLLFTPIDPAKNQTKSVMTFQTNVPYVLTMGGEAVHDYDDANAEEKREQAEVNLRNYLLTHPAIMGEATERNEHAD